MVELSKPRIEYLSKSKNKFIDIESMNECHLINAIRKMVMDARGAEFRIVHKDYAEKSYISNTITEVEVVKD